MITINKNKNDLNQILETIQNLPSKNTQVNLQEITITPTNQVQTITPSPGYSGFSKVIIEAAAVTTGGLPTFTYTGQFQIIEEDNENWQIKLKTSGNLVFEKEVGYIDVFCVGGGGAGAGYGGGGGGYTTTANYLPYIDTTYSMYIGEGASTSDARGGTTSAFNGTIQAEGGYSSTYTSNPKNSKGGAGGSGGGGSGDNVSNARQTVGGDGGSDGENGGDGRYVDDDGGTKSAYDGGQGQKNIGLGTTRAFGESNGELYAGGGGANCNGGQSFEGSGGAGGGGDAGYDGHVNMGGGGGGSGGRGGSGIIIIRNRR